MTRKCYPAMVHEEGDIIEPRDCVLLKAGQRKNELPFVAKIAALWENLDDGKSPYKTYFVILYYYYLLFRRNDDVLAVVLPP